MMPFLYGLVTSIATLTGRSLLLKEIIFWVWTSFVTISAVLILAELERRGLPWRVLLASAILPIDRLVQMAGIDIPKPRELDCVRR